MIFDGRKAFNRRGVYVLFGQMNFSLAKAHSLIISQPDQEPESGLFVQFLIPITHISFLFVCHTGRSSVSCSDLSCLRLTLGILCRDDLPYFIRKVK